MIDLQNPSTPRHHGIQERASLRAGYRFCDQQCRPRHEQATESNLAQSEQSGYAFGAAPLNRNHARGRPGANDQRRGRRDAGSIPQENFHVERMESHRHRDHHEDRGDDHLDIRDSEGVVRHYEATACDLIDEESVKGIKLFAREVAPRLREVKPIVAE